MVISHETSFRDCQKFASQEEDRAEHGERYRGEDACGDDQAMWVVGNFDDNVYKAIK